ncbi:MAG TPA: hypothetical protein VHN37_06140 [Actinomycetota bacterium]|nr:hypothetical protein [Actinomycetota bacterium]
MLRSFARVALSALLLAVVLPGTSRADHEDGYYELPALVWWEDAHLSVLVIPPNHGQLFNADGGILAGNDPAELTPFNSYLDAIEQAIAAWDEAIETLGADWLRAAYQVDVYVAGRDDVPPEVLTNPDILVVTDESEGGALGTAVRLDPCIVRMSKLEIMSFSYADMYNVTAQEFGHCLGLRHVGSQGGVDPLSDLKHPEHDVMNGFYTHFVGDPGTHLHCISNLDVLGLEAAFAHEHPGAEAIDMTVLMPVDAYGDTCSPPPADWRLMLPEGQVGRPEAPDPRSEITSPANGATVRSRDLTHVEGTAASREWVEVVDVALARAAGDGCEWWSPGKKKFVRKPCEEPLWSQAKGTDEWSWAVRAQLPKGRYRALSRADNWIERETSWEHGVNLVDFRVR